MNAKQWLVPVIGIALVLCQPEMVRAQGRVQAARAAAEFIIERFGRPAAREGVEVLTRKIESAAARYGEEAIVAARRVGPQFFKVVEAAGAGGSRAVRIMAKHGEPGVVWVLSRPKGMQLLLLHGEEAAAVLIRHPGGIAEPFIEQFGGPAVKALQAVGPQSGRRLAMMLSEGELANIGRTPELMGVVAQYGDRAMEFIWKHKFTLAGTAALGAYLVNPEPFLSGARDITQVVAENAIRPLAEVPGKVAQEAASRIRWNLVVVAFLIVGAGAAVILLSRCRSLIRLWLGGAGRVDGFTLPRSCDSTTPAVEPPAPAYKPLHGQTPPSKRRQTDVFSREMGQK